MAKYRILTLDGGGIRGLLTARILERLDYEVAGWRDGINMIAGTSTGGIIALALAFGLTPAETRQFYQEKGPIIFRDTALDDLKDSGRVTGADYSTEPLRMVLEEIFGDTRLADLKKKVLIPAFDLDNENPNPALHSWKAKFFHNFSGSDSDGHEKAVDVALYSSAAPTFFPSVDGYIDGGVIANNPSMAALAQTQDARSRIADSANSFPHEHPALTDVVLLSLGTGNTTSFVPGENMDWGLAQWSHRLLKILLDSPGGISDYQCRQFLGERYRRLNPVLPTNQNFELDDISIMPDLIRVADSVDLADCGIVDWLKTTWQD